jgi:hypothetical protein
MSLVQLAKYLDEKIASNAAAAEAAATVVAAKVKAKRTVKSAKAAKLKAAETEPEAEPPLHQAPPTRFDGASRFPEKLWNDAAAFFAAHRG